MAIATVDKAVNENDIEVFVRTPEQIAGETCDKDGIYIPARYSASKGDQVLFFCAHHVRKYSDNLTKQGFTIFPEDISYNAGLAK